MSKIKNQMSNVKNFRQRRGGFTLLLSLIVISILLSIGIGVFEIIAREIRISSIGRESQIAFYAANAGAECAFYLEIIVGGSNIGNCASKNITLSDSYGFELNYKNKITEVIESCVEVKVERDASSGITTVESRGYNMACDGESPIKVQRAVRLNIKKKQ